MANALYTRLRASTLRLIKSKGAQAVFSRETGQSGYDPVTQQRVTATANGSWTRWALGVPPGRSWSFRNNTEITSDMEELHVAPEAYTPMGGDRVQWKGQADWKVVDAAIYDPDGSGVIYFRVLIGK
jgi:hypothetical protein